MDGGSLPLGGFHWIASGYIIMCVLSVSTKESTSSSSINSMLVGIAVDGVEACVVRLCSL